MINIIKMALVNLFAISLLINMTYAYIPPDNTMYIEKLQLSKEVQCIPEITNRTNDVSSFLCKTKIGENSINHRIFFYQIEGYDRDLWHKSGKYGESANKNLREYYADKSKINLDSIDGKDIDALIALINQKKITVKIADIPNAIADGSSISVIGTVYLNDVDIGLELIKKGFAWASPPQWEDNLEYDEAQKVAKENTVGYWSELNVVSPWDMQVTYTDYKNKTDAKDIARYKKERIQNLVLSWFFFITIPLGFIALVNGIYKARSFILVFVFLIPYFAIGANILLVAMHVYNPNSLYALYGFVFTIPIAVISIFLGFLAAVIKGLMNK